MLLEASHLLSSCRRSLCPSGLLSLIFSLLLNIKRLLYQQLLAVVNIYSGCCSCPCRILALSLLRTEKSIHILLCCRGRPLVQIIEHLFIRSLLALRFGGGYGLLGRMLSHVLLLCTSNDDIS